MPEASGQESAVAIVGLDYLRESGRALSTSPGTARRKPRLQRVVEYVHDIARRHQLGPVGSVFALVATDTSPSIDREAPQLKFLDAIREAGMLPVAVDWRDTTLSNPYGPAADSGVGPRGNEQLLTPLIAALAGLALHKSNIIVLHGSFDLAVPLQLLLRERPERTVVIGGFDGCFDGRWFNRGLLTEAGARAGPGRFSLELLDADEVFEQERKRGAWSKSGPLGL